MDDKVRKIGRRNFEVIMNEDYYLMLLVDSGVRGYECTFERISQNVLT